jgi:putative phosphoribosyl transferase
MALEQPFRNRFDAGRVLASLLGKHARRPDVLVLALPRGGVPVGFEVAQALEAPLDVFVVRKLGVPGFEELAMGAIASGGVRVENASVLQSLGISKQIVNQVAERELNEVRRRERQYRGDQPPPPVEGRTVILVDDGLATGATMAVAAAALRRLKPARIVIAVPVAAPETCEQFRQIVDEIICAYTPEDFSAVGRWYEDFSQVSDEEVRDLLQRSREAHAPSHN